MYKKEVVFGQAAYALAPEKTLDDYTKGMQPNTVAMAEDVVGPSAKKLVKDMNDGEVVLLENTRYRAEETKNGEAFSKELADLAGVRVFATGGIGGVHRGAQETFDISADLQELANTNVAVICAGAKSILDIGLTLEYLETNGVPVIGFGTDEFPAFYTRKSGFGVDYRVDSSLEVAEALKAKWDLNLNGGMVIGNPIPEQFEMDYDTITNAIETALREADENNITGKKVTPFLLDKVKTITAGQSLASNIELVYNNAKVAAQIATDLANLK